MDKFIKKIASARCFLIFCVIIGSASAKCEVTPEENQWGNIKCFNTSLDDSLYYIYDAFNRPVDMALAGIIQLQITYSDIYTIDYLDRPYLDHNFQIHKLSINFCGVQNIASHAFNDLGLYAIHILDLKFNQIKSNLQFLAHLPNSLQELDLSHNEIEYIDFQMLNICLGTLNLSFNKLMHLMLVTVATSVHFPIKDLLDVSHNKIFKTYINATFTDTFEINFQYNNLGEIRDFTNGKFSYLKTLDLSNSIFNNSLLDNYKSNFHFAPAVLNMSNCSLKYIMNKIHLKKLPESFEFLPILNFSYNNLNYLDGLVLDSSSSYNLVDFSFNQIQHFNGTLNFYSIGELNLANNKITKLNPIFFGNFSIIRVLDLSYNKLELADYNFKFSGILENLDLSHCSLKDMHDFVFAGIRNLKIINLENNMLANLSLNTFKPLTTINEIKLSYNKLKTLQTGLFQSLPVRYIQICYNELTNIEPKAFDTLPNLGWLNIDNNKKRLEIDDQAFLSLTHINKVSLRRSKLFKFSLRSFHKTSSLEHLDIRDNDFSQMHFSATNKHINLQKIDVSFNGTIPSKAFLGLETLLSLTIWNSNISNVENRAFQGLYQLKSLTTENTYVDNIEYGALEGLFNLQTFNAKEIFSEKGIMGHIFKDFYFVQKLDFVNVNITLIQSNAFKGLYRLMSINLSNCSISLISNDAFDGPKNLLFLDLSYNYLLQLKLTHFKGLDNLKALNLSHNKIGDIETGALQYFPTLEILNLNNNNLTELKTGTFSNLILLRKLDLQKNSISTLLFETFFPLESLTHLNLEFNNLKTISHLSLVSNLKYLNRIGIAKNKWRCEYLGDMLMTLKNYSIDYSSENVNYNDDNISGIDCIDICKYLLCLKDSHYGTN